MSYPPLLEKIQIKLFTINIVWGLFLKFLLGIKQLQFEVFPIKFKIRGGFWCFGGKSVYLCIKQIQTQL